TTADLANGQKTVNLGSAATLGVSKGNPLVGTATDANGNTSEFSAAQSNYTTFLVTNTGDGGLGSLRQAITDANTQGGTDIIAFRIPGSGIHTIAPTSALPTVADPVVLDATTQPGYSNQP